MTTPNRIRRRSTGAAAQPLTNPAVQGDPRKRIMAISYANELTRKHAADFRTIVESPWFRGSFRTSSW